MATETVNTLCYHILQLSCLSGGLAGDEDMDALRDRLAELEAENRDLKNELNAFDPGFFEEIEDLKHEHHVLSNKVQEYERLITQLSAQLGRPPPPGMLGSNFGRAGR